MPSREMSKGWVVPQNVTSDAMCSEAEVESLQQLLDTLWKSYTQETLRDSTKARVGWTSQRRFCLRKCCQVGDLLVDFWVEVDASGELGHSACDGPMCGWQPGAELPSQRRRMDLEGRGGTGELMQNQSQRKPCSPDPEPTQLLGAHETPMVANGPPNRHRAFQESPS